jgi:DNA-binding transcriptional regulator YhcF (GntR family)
MKLWLSRNSEIPLREQLTRQIIFAIASGDLHPGDKLPSVRELATRFHIHQNTASAAYKKLESEGWVEARKGSGVFVCDNSNEKQRALATETEDELDEFVSKFFRSARRRGFTRKQIAHSVSRFLSRAKPEQILVVDDDPELRQILFTEIRTALKYRTLGASVEDFLKDEFPSASIVVAMPESFEKLQTAGRTNSQTLLLKINSAQAELTGRKRPESHELIGIVSHLEKFLLLATTFLVAAGIENENLVIRDARERDFRKGLESCAFIVCDSATAQILPKTFDLKIFRLIAEESLNELRELIK